MNKLHYNTVAPALLEIIHKIFRLPALDDFRLGGGTALALQTGHRISADADFICDKNFDSRSLIPVIYNEFGNVTDVNTGTHGLRLKINNLKIDFLTWNIPFIRTRIEIDDLSLLHIEEIIAMKLFAILQRGEKKDYMDIASLMKLYTVKQILAFYSERHKGNDIFLVLKFLVSWSDIEKQPEPIMLNGLEWNDCKMILKSAVDSFFTNSE